MTDSAVLVLNNLYQAVQITSVRRAFRLFYAGRARAVAPDFRTYDFENWTDLPAGAGHAVIVGTSIRALTDRPDGTLDPQEIEDAFRSLALELDRAFARPASEKAAL